MARRRDPREVKARWLAYFSEPDRIRATLAEGDPDEVNAIVEAAKKLLAQNVEPEEVRPMLRVMRDHLPELAVSLLGGVLFEARPREVAMVRALLDAGLDPNVEIATEEEGEARTLLGRAIPTGADMARLLLQYGAWPDGVEADALRIAFRDDRLIQAIQLTRAGASPHLWPYDQVRALLRRRAGSFPHLQWHLAGLSPIIRRRLPGYPAPDAIGKDVYIAQASLEHVLNPNLARYVWAAI